MMEEERSPDIHWRNAISFVKHELEALDLDPFKLKKCDPSKLASLGENDILVSSYPRSGGSLVSEILHNIVTSIQSMYETEVMKHDIRVFEETTPQEVDNTGKIYTTRLRYNYLAQHVGRSKVVYVVRNPKHAAIQLYNSSFFKHMSFPEFVDLFLGGVDEEDPYNYKRHFLQYLENEEELNILFLKYEDLEVNPRAAVQNLLDHIGLGHVTLDEKTLRQVMDVREPEGDVPISWNVLAQSINSNNFGTFFDPKLLVKFEREIKVDWKLVKSGTV